MRHHINIKHKILDYIRTAYHVVRHQRTQEHFLRYIRTKDKKDPGQIKDELASLKKYWGCFPMQYYTHDFYSKTCTLTLDEMKSFIPSYFFYKIIYPAYDNIEMASSLLSDKITMNNLFNTCGISQSNIALIKTDDTFSFFSGERIDNKDVTEYINSLSSTKLFIKPVHGSGGAGILIANINSNNMFEFNNEIIDVNFLAALTGNYVLETNIEQSDYISDVYPHSVNTIRAITKREANGNVSLIAATLRMGINGSQIDNGSAGGILIGIELTTGRALRNFATYEFGSERFYQHPDTKFVFKELKIPNWDVIQQQILDSAVKLTQINLVGWDAAITADGAVMIEANTMFGIDHMQAGIGGLRDHFVEI